MRNKNIFWGLFFIVAAALVLVNKMGIFANVNLFGIVISVFLGAFLVENLVKLNWNGVFFPAAFLAIIYSDVLGIQNLTPWPVLLAALLLSIGFSMVFKKKPRWAHEHKHMESFGLSREEVNGEYVYLKNRFNSSTKYVKSTELSKAELDCSFGESSIYFDEVRIKGDHADIYVNASFGETKIFLPREWNVTNKINYSLADVKEVGTCSSTGVPTVTLTGNVSFGEVVIQYI